MGLPGKKGKKGSSSDGNWKKVGALWQDKDDESRLFATTDDYSGELYFRDKDSGEYYKVNFISLFEPKKHKNAKKALPKNLLYNMSVNLNNPEAAELVEEE